MMSSMADLQAPMTATLVKSGDWRAVMLAAKYFEWKTRPVKGSVVLVAMEGRRGVDVCPVERMSLSAKSVSSVAVVSSHPLP